MEYCRATQQREFNTSAIHCIRCSEFVRPYPPSDIGTRTQTVCKTGNHLVCAGCADRQYMCPVCKVPFVQHTIEGYGILTSPLPFLDTLVFSCSNDGCSQMFSSADKRDLHSSINCMHRIDTSNKSIAKLFATPKRVKITAQKVATGTHAFVYDDPSIKTHTFEFCDDTIYHRAIITIDIGEQTLTCHASSHICQATVRFGSFSTTFLLQHGPKSTALTEATLMDTIEVSVAPLYAPQSDTCSLRIASIGLPHVPILQGPFIPTEYTQIPALVAAAGQHAENITIIHTPVESNKSQQILICLYDDRKFTYERLAICPSCMQPFRVSAIFEHIGMSREYVEQYSHVVDKYERGQWMYRGSAMSPCANRLAGGDVQHLLRSGALREYSNKFPMARQLTYFAATAPPVYYGFFATLAGVEQLIAISYVDTEAARCCICGTIATANTVDPSEILIHMGIAATDATRLRKLVLTSDRREMVMSDDLFETFAIEMQSEFQ